MPAPPPKRVSLHKLFRAFDQHTDIVRAAKAAARRGPVTAMQRHIEGCSVSVQKHGIARIDQCRKALEALDRRGWDRSFHQRMFHEEYLKSCARIFFKRDGAGSFARAHARLLEVNGWDSTPQVSSAPLY